MSRLAKQFYVILLIFLVSHLAQARRSSKFRPKKTKNIGSNEICRNENCKRTAEILKESIDINVDPCDDFYGYVCGRWNDDHKDPNPWILIQSKFSEKELYDYKKIVQLFYDRKAKSDHNPWAIKQAIQFYASCMYKNTTEEMVISQMYSTFRKIGIRNVYEIFRSRNQSSKTPINIESLLAKVKRFFNFGILFDAGVIPDPRNNSRNILSLYFPIGFYLLLPGWRPRTRILQIYNGYLDMYAGRKMIRFVEPFLQHEFLEQRRKLPKGDHSSDLLTDSITNNVLTTVKKIAKFSQDSNTFKEKLVDVEQHSYLSLDELQNVTDTYVKSLNKRPKLIWKNYVNELLKGIKKFDPEEELLIFDIEYFKKIALFFARTSETDIEMMIWWNSLEFANQVVSITVDKSDQLEAEILRCTKTTNMFLGFAVSRLYLKSFTSSTYKNKHIDEMLDNIKSSFVNNVDKLDWMDNSTKSKVKRKNDKMNFFVGYPDWMMDDRKLNDFYSGLNISKTNFIENVQQLQANDIRNQLRQLLPRKQYENKWPTSPIDYNAYYLNLRNEIYIPFNSLQFPFYDFGLQALNYGSLGSILGHEMMHAYDEYGRNYDMNANLNHWWSNETISGYYDRAECLIKQYEGMDLRKLGFKTDYRVWGRGTLEENVADNAGLKQSFFAYQKWKSKNGGEPRLARFSQFSHERLFFLAYAQTFCEVYPQHSSVAIAEQLIDEHPPGHVRVNAVLQNFEEFSRAWNCSATSNMNPSVKCHVW